MRRDVVRIGLGRSLFEGALGVVLVRPMDDTDRVLAIALAIAAAMLAHVVIRRSRRAFVAAHVGLAAAAIAIHLEDRLATPLLAAGLGAAIEIAHVDLVQRRRLSEHVRSLRIPSSLLVRRLGSVVVVAVVGSAMLPLVSMGARPSGLAPIFVVLGAVAVLMGGFSAGPGRPVTRPFDAAIFVLLGIVLAFPVH